jgi:signal transduction histidine kinase
MNEYTFPTQTETISKNLMLNIAELQVHQRQLVNNLSHELRTPLTLIYGYIQSIRRRGDNLTNLQKDALEIAILETKHTIDLLQQFLDLARLDSASICFRIRPLDLNSLVLSAIATFAEIDRKIMIDGEELNITVIADAEFLQQTISKLIDNAIRYSDQMITIKLEQLDNYAAISICDRGCGIPVKDQPHIFSPFYRVDQSRNRLTGGAGLGLAIAKVLVEGMGGTLSVHSQLNEGSIFKIMLKSSP